ncbi:MAG: nitroreductase family protein [Lachnospiraceae bacterium]|nr:nitroreductase family protein [Lachnospiraceae bacterium]
MNETLQTIKNRYSCRSYTGEPVEKEKIEAITLAGVQAPSALNKQPWQLIVLQDKSYIEEMDASVMDMLSKQQDTSTYERMMLRGGKVFYNAPCMIIIAKEAGTDLDTGIVVENMALAASSLGLGNVICGLMNLSFDTEKGDKFKAKLIPDGYEFGVALLVGYATEDSKTPHEPDLSKVKYIG